MLAIQLNHPEQLELGGASEGERGPRAFGEFAYLRDLDGNQLAVFCPRNGERKGRSRPRAFVQVRPLRAEQSPLDFAIVGS